LRFEEAREINKRQSTNFLLFEISRVVDDLPHLTRILFHLEILVEISTFSRGAAIGASLMC
jgi:hypothetical protein